MAVTGATSRSRRPLSTIGTHLPGLEAINPIHLFPDPLSVAGAGRLSLGAPRSRQLALRAFSAAVEVGDVDQEVRPPLQEFVEEVSRLPGLGTWTGQFLALRAGYDDASPSSDLGIRRQWRHRGQRRSPEAAQAMATAFASGAGPWPSPWGWLGGAGRPSAT